jgi:hypothetical protein
LLGIDYRRVATCGPQTGASPPTPATPLKLEFAHTRLATGEDAAWIERRFVDACAALGTKATVRDGRLVARWR